MQIMLAGSIAGKTKEREKLLQKNHRLLSFWEIHNKLFNAPLSFKIIKARKTHLRECGCLVNGHGEMIKVCEYHYNRG